MNPSEMTDEELNKVIETGIAPEEQVAVPEVETSTEVTPDKIEDTKPEDETPKVPEDETPEEPKQTSRRESLRIQQLINRHNQQPSQPVRTPNTSPNAIDYSTALDADPEVIQQLIADRQTVSDAAYLEGLRQSQIKDWKRDLKYEAPTVEQKFSFLNPKDVTSYNPAAANAMNQKYLRFIGYNPGDAQNGIPETVQYPDLSYGEFVESEMEFVDELATQKIAQTTKNIAKQASMTGLRPDGSSAKRLNLNQAPEKMSIEELYASIGQTAPKK